VEAGDYSGFSGAAKALAQPGVDFAVLETARGGILLRGIGTGHNDVAVVTNVTEDHLDQYGIRTIDQLAEVKATITRITRPDGWDVLNADDPRVLAMRRLATGRPWLFSLDADHPAIRTTLAEGGRAISVLDHALVVMSSRRHVHHLLPLEDVPVALAGISSPYLRNAMAAVAAALGAGVPEDAERPRGVAVDLEVVGGPGERVDPGLQVQHPLHGRRRGRVLAELRVGVGEDAVGRRAVRIGSQSPLPVDDGVAEQVPGIRQGAQARLGKEVPVGMQLEGVLEGTLGLRIVGRVDGDAALLDVGGAQVCPRLPAVRVGLELALGRCDTGG